MLESLGFFLFIGVLSYLTMVIVDLFTDRKAKKLEAIEREDEALEDEEAILLSHREAQTMVSLQKEDARLEAEVMEQKKQETLDWLQERMKALEDRKEA